jgi:hypothetical protein
MNKSQIAVYAGTTAVDDPFGLLNRAEQITFSTTYPGGYYDSLNCFIPCDPTTRLPFTYLNTLIVRDGLTTIWRGDIISITLVINANRSGVEISAVGQLAYLKYTSTVRRWIDRRFSSQMAGVWEYQTSATSEKCTPDQYNRLMLTPKAVAWTTGEYVAFKYSTYNNSEVKKLTFTYDLQDGTQDNLWELNLYDQDAGANVWSVTGTATGSATVTIASTSGLLWFRLKSLANQTPPADGTIYGKITNLAVFGTNPSGTIVTTVADVIKAYCALLSYTDYTHFGTNTYDLTTAGFVADDLTETFLESIQRVMQFSAGNDAYSFGFNDYGLPYFEMQPVLTDYDYIVNLAESNISGFELVLSADYGEIYNEIFVRRTDEDGKMHIVTSGDDSGLRDDTSKTKYRQRVYRAEAGTSAQAGAVDVGKQTLKAKKDLQYYVRQPLVMHDTILSKNGVRVPVAQVRAGRRIRIENFSTDAGDALGAGLTFLISRTEYNDDTNSISISCGTPDDLALYLARREVMNNRQL